MRALHQIEKEEFELVVGPRPRHPFVFHNGKESDRKGVYFDEEANVGWDRKAQLHVIAEDYISDDVTSYYAVKDVTTWGGRSIR